MRVQRVQFNGSNGHLLSARLEMPNEAPHAFALFAHCYTCGKDALAATRISQGLAGHGYGVLRFDFAGIGASEGDFADTNFSSNIADLLAAADFLRTHHRAPALLVGHSFGGAATLAAAGDIPEARAIVTIGAPSDPGQVQSQFRRHVEQIQREGEADVLLAGRPFRIKRQLLEDVAGYTLAERIARLDRALMVMHSPLDDTVDIANAMRIFSAAKHPKSFVSLDDIDHLVTRKEDAAYLAGLIAAWGGRYIG